MDLHVIYVRLKDRARDLSQHWDCAASEVALDLKHTCEELMSLVEAIIAEKRTNARIRDSLERRIGMLESTLRELFGGADRGQQRAKGRSAAINISGQRPE
jgi:hypothetical protein